MAAGAGAAVAAPAAAAAIPVAAAEERPATPLATAALAPVPKPFCHGCLGPFDVYLPVFTASKFLLMSPVDLFVFYFFYFYFLFFHFCISCPDVLVDDLGM